MMILLCNKRYCPIGKEICCVECERKKCQFKCENLESDIPCEHTVEQLD